MFCNVYIIFYKRLFLGDLLYFIVTPHWMCTNVQRPLLFPHRFCSAKGPPGCPGRELNPGLNKWQADALTIELRLTPLCNALPQVSYASPLIIYSTVQCQTFQHRQFFFKGTPNKQNVNCSVNRLNRRRGCCPCLGFRRNQSHGPCPWPIRRHGRRVSACSEPLSAS